MSVFIVLLVIRFLPVLVIWLPQALVFGRNLIVFPVLLFIIALILIPLFIKWYRWLIGYRFVDDNSEPVLLFALGSLCWLITYWNFHDSSLDSHFHDTYFIISFVSVCRYISLGFGILAIVYFVFPMVSGRNLNLNLSRFHFWCTYMGMNVLIVSWSNDLSPGPRRYFEYAGWNSYAQSQLFDKFILSVTILVIVAQLLFLFNIVASLLRKSKI